MAGINTWDVDVRFTINGVEASKAMEDLTKQAVVLADAVRAINMTLDDLSAQVEDTGLAEE